MSYLRDRFMAMHDLLTETGSIFVQIGDENVHRVRAVFDEVFGSRNCIAQITVEKTSAQTSDYLSESSDYVLMYARNKDKVKFRNLLRSKEPTDSMMSEYSNFEDDRLVRGTLGKQLESDWRRAESRLRLFSKDTTTSSKPPGSFAVNFRGSDFTPGNGYWKTGEIGFVRLIKANRLEPRGTALRYVRFFRDFPVSPINNIWSDVRFSSRREDKNYVVQSSVLLIERCILMATDPGDLVLDPTCGSGTTAFVSEQWGRRWITVDTSRVALTLARTRLMSARFPYYAMRDSEAGAVEELALQLGRRPTEAEAAEARAKGPFTSDIAHGLVLNREPHITLKSIANNAEIDVLYEQH